MEGILTSTLIIPSESMNVCMQNMVRNIQTVTHGCGSLALDLDVATPENVLCVSPHGWLNGFSPQRELWGLATRMSFVMSVQNVTQ